jgi:high-affinity nickel-transport protein
LNADANLRDKIICVYAFLFAVNIAAWSWALVAFRDYPVLLGTAIIAYGFGLRHAFDADHLAAIDNVTRKLMQGGNRHVGVGLFFALGHSTIVVIATCAIVMTANTFHTQFETIRSIGGVIGTLVSALFLIAIAFSNLLVVFSIYRILQTVKRGGSLAAEDLDLTLANRGPLGALFSRFFRLIGKSWQMYPLGMFFGLGFDTATEIGLLGITATQISQGLPIWSILVFPALFTAGMSLIDATDSILMLGAYGWAFVKPIRKLYYNLTISSISVVIAFLVGGIELFNLIGRESGLWAMMGMLNENFNTLGFLIIAVFAGVALISSLFYRSDRYAEIEVLPARVEAK